MRDLDLDRLLRSAAKSGESPTTTPAPFGFDTRVVALMRAARGESSGAWQEFAWALRRIAAVAVVVMAFAGVGAYWQLSENDDDKEPLTNAYAIADNAIDLDLLQ
ncbi:MAG: hypothetical protein M3Y69_05475 [Verrucomicrobiota bacterium]|nr:hypothetical protein [Verrucomicrobiota bacterium]